MFAVACCVLPVSEVCPGGSGEGSIGCNTSVSPHILFEELTHLMSLLL